MAYLPDHKADVFISYAHVDNFAWIEGFSRELEKALVWKLRASTKPEIFFDTESLRSGRVFDKEIAECLEATGFFLRRSAFFFPATLNTAELIWTRMI